MQRLGSLFVAACMLLIAGAAGYALHYAVGLPRVEAALVALALLFALMLAEILAVRSRERNQMVERYEDLAGASAEIAREIGELGHRVAALEGVLDVAAKTTAEAISRDLKELTVHVHELAETVSLHDTLLAAPRPGEATSMLPAGVRRKGRVPRPFAGMSELELQALLREAVADNRIELYFQPVVALPSRKVRFYEALSRLKLTDGTIVDAGHFLSAASAAGLLPRIDQRQTLQCVQIVRRLAARSRDVGFFINLAPETLADRRLFSELLGYLDANRALAPSLMFEIAQPVFRALAGAERQSFDALAERGFHFSIDHVEDLQIDPREIAAHRVRFLKVPCDLMLRRMNETSGLRPNDLADLLGRYAIDLVVERIEREAAVVQLLDCDVRYGQGFLFAPPRAVRAEVLRGEPLAPKSETAPASEPADEVTARPRA